MSTMVVPFCDLRREHAAVRADLHAALDACLDDSVFVRGHATHAFEKAFAQFVGTEHCVGVGNGADALELVLRALGVGPGDEVITVPNTFFATASAVALTGATLVLADVGADGLMDAADVAHRITPRTRAVIPVHLYGACVNMDALLAVTSPHARIAVIEDACQAHGAAYKGCQAGSLGRAAAFSFYPTKNLGALGDGGAVTTNDGELAERLRALANYGSRRRYLHATVGKNSRLDALQAQFLHLKLPHLRAAVRARRMLAQRYLHALADLPLRLPRQYAERQHAYHLFAVGVVGGRREALHHALRRAGVETLVHYPVAIHQQAAFAGQRWGSFPNSEQHVAETLSLPLFVGMRDSEQEHVVQAVRYFFAGEKP